jgi:hypothetical protein
LVCSYALLGWAVISEARALHIVAQSMYAMRFVKNSIPQWQQQTPI